MHSSENLSEKVAANRLWKSTKHDKVKKIATLHVLEYDISGLFLLVFWLDPNTICAVRNHSYNIVMLYVL